MKGKQILTAKQDADLILEILTLSAPDNSLIDNAEYEQMAIPCLCVTAQRRDAVYGSCLGMNALKGWGVEHSLAERSIHTSDG